MREPTGDSRQLTAKSLKLRKAGSVVCLPFRRSLLLAVGCRLSAGG
jgi:hypothetical protein